MNKQEYESNPQSYWENMIVTAGLYVLEETKIEGGFVKYKICPVQFLSQYKTRYRHFLIYLKPGGKIGKLNTDCLRNFFFRQAL